MSVDIFEPGLSAMPAGVEPERRPNPFARRGAIAAVAAFVVVGALGFALQSRGSAPPATTPVVVAPEVAAPVLTRPGDAVGTIGDTWITYPDGLAVQVIKLAEYALPGQSLQDTAYSTGVVVSVALKNETGKSFDAEWANVTLKYGPFGQSARPTYDKYQGQRFGGMFFDGTIPAGATETTRFGFSVPVEYLGELSVEIRPGIKSAPSEFAGALVAQATPTPTPVAIPTTFDE